MTDSIIFIVFIALVPPVCFLVVPKAERKKIISAIKKKFKKC